MSHKQKRRKIQKHTENYTETLYFYLLLGQKKVSGMCGPKGW